MPLSFGCGRVNVGEGVASTKVTPPGAAVGAGVAAGAYAPL